MLLQFSFLWHLPPTLWAPEVIGGVDQGFPERHPWRYVGAPLALRGLVQDEVIFHVAQHRNIGSCAHSSFTLVIA
jgi:hypothetical protein